MRRLLLLFGSVFIFLMMVQPEVNNRIVANPLNLNYRFQPDDPSRREAADPVIEYFKGKYYLFASKSGGYWSSIDLVSWTYIPCTTISTIENYAPTALVLGDTIYYLASGSTKIYYTTDPDIDNWNEIYPSQFTISETDPSFFKDDDTGKVYVYWGCSDKDPIKGVEVDPTNGFKSIGEPSVLIEHNTDLNGWEIPGNTNNESRNGWNEGATVLQFNGKYYLQYASPGTEYRTYADGVYVGYSPLGPFTYQKNSPFSIKPGGFIGGAGHGHTFKDEYGNFWHVATMRISQRHPFERRIGLFPVYIDENENMFTHTVWTDYPFEIPDSKVDFSKSNYSLNWSLLSYKKQTKTSSSLGVYGPDNACDEAVETWWSAQTGNVGEWWQVDLGDKMSVHAIQVNFADMGFTNKSSDSYIFYQYIIESSENGQNWTALVDKTQNLTDSPHELIVLDTVKHTRYLRITNTRNMSGKFSLSDFRVFGRDQGKQIPDQVSGLQIIRKTDKRRFFICWDKQDKATGYVVHWGISPENLNNAIMVFDNQLEAGFFNRDVEYYFSVKAFNENGITSDL